MDEVPSPRNTEPSTPGISERGRRGLKVIALSAIVVVAASLAWMYPTLAAKTKFGSPPVPTPLPATRPGDFVTYQFVSPSVGWSLGIPLGPSSTGEFYVARTWDGAKHWERQLRGQVRSRFAGTPSLQFFDQKHGFVAVGVPIELRRTVDGGLTWTTLRLPDPQGYFVTFSDTRHGWLLAGAYQTQIAAPSLYATDDAGDSWQRLPGPPLGSNRIAFRSPQEGWLWTFNQSSQFLNLSRNGGQSWQSIDIPEPPGRSAEQTLMVVNLRLVPLVGVVASLGFRRGDVFQVLGIEIISFDMGKSWTYVQRPAQNQNQDQWFLRWDSFEDATHWWLIDRGNLYKSSDAGQTWKPVAVKLENGDNWPYRIQVVDSIHAWCQVQMGERTGLVMTSDGGLHWTRMNVPQPPS